MEERVLNVLKRVLELTEIDETCSQQSCEAWDSLRHLDLAVELEMEFDIIIEPEEITQMKSFEDILKIVSSKVGERKSI